MKVYLTLPDLIESGFKNCLSWKIYYFSVSLHVPVFVGGDGSGGGGVVGW